MFRSLRSAWTSVESDAAMSIARTTRTIFIFSPLFEYLRVGTQLWKTPHTKRDRSDGASDLLGFHKVRVNAIQRKRSRVAPASTAGTDQRGVAAHEREG